MSKPRILVIEDEDAIRAGICDLLAYHGLEPVGAATGDAGLASAFAGGWDLLMVDVMLPGVDGFSICRQVRERDPGQAILMLTAKGREEDVLEGFAAGCDDYITKPFSVAQLVARVKALLRRQGTKVERNVTSAGVTLQPDALRAHADDQTVALSTRDVEVIAYLARQRPGVVSRTDLLREVWGYKRVERVETRAVDMHIVKLRRKLSRITQADVIETVRGAGYRLAP